MSVKQSLVTGRITTQGITMLSIILRAVCKVVGRNVESVVSTAQFMHS